MAYCENCHDYRVLLSLALKHLKEHKQEHCHSCGDGEELKYCSKAPCELKTLINDIRNRIEAADSEDHKG